MDQISNRYQVRQQRQQDIVQSEGKRKECKPLKGSDRRYTGPLKHEPIGEFHQGFRLAVPNISS
jgi:hypothetical protein